MKQSLKQFLSRLQERSTNEGFAILKNIRGGTLPDNANSHCENSNTCGSTNSDCNNSGDCSKTTNTGTRGCTNYICFD